MCIAKKLFIFLVLSLFVVSCGLNEIQDVTNTVSTDKSETNGNTMSHSNDTTVISPQTTNIGSEPAIELPETAPLDLSPIELPDGFYDSISLPKIEDFSGTELEDYKWRFSPIKSAKLICGDKSTEISPNDPRLIRLLNFLTFGEQVGEKEYTLMRQSYVLEDEINEYLASPSPMLKVYFDTTESNPEWRDNPEIIISGNTYLLILPTKDAEYHGERIMAEQFWAYEALMRDAELPFREKISNSSLLDRWSNPNLYWLDLIEYAGFLTE